MTDTTEILEKMDAAAREAEKELRELPEDAVRKVAAWWKKWYLKAGHKRLGRLLLTYAREERE